MKSPTFTTFVTPSEKPISTLNGATYFAETTESAILYLFSYFSRTHSLLQHKEVDPFFDNILMVFPYKILCRLGVFFRQGLLSGTSLSDFRQQTIIHYQLEDGFLIRLYHVHVNRLVLIGIEKEDKTKIFKNLRHIITSLRNAFRHVLDKYTEKSRTVNNLTIRLSCPKPGSNRHVFKGHWILSPTRLPIPPFGHIQVDFSSGSIALPLP